MIAAIVPVRDQARFLGEALASIAAQSLPASELIVVDDGSADGSGAVAAGAGATVITLTGEGPAAARIAGARATGLGWLAFVDGDDRILPHHHELLLAAALGAGADFAFGQVREFADPGSGVEHRYEIRTEPRLAPLAGACLVRRDVYLAAASAAAQDGEHDWIGPWMDGGRSAQVEEVVLERRIHGANRSIVDRAEVHAAYLASARAAIMRRRSSR